VAESGYLLVLVLVFGSIFITIVGSFVGYIVTQNQVVNFRHEQQRATDIAESGLNYYKWFLAHNPGDVTNGTGGPGPYVQQYTDPVTALPIGEFSLEISSSTYCGELSSIDITSTGHTYDNPAAKAIVRGRYARPTVAGYHMITNSGVNFSSAGVVTGPVHSNQGIRMEKAHNSVVSSGLTDWWCDSGFGCSPSATVDGVFTTGALANPSLFSFPVAPIDFGGITLNLAQMQDKAENYPGGIYIPPAGGSRQGYWLRFLPGNQLSVRRVNTKTAEPGGLAWGYYYNKINGTSPYATYTIDPACPVIFVEDQIWIEGQIDTKVTVAAADVDTPGEDPSVIINADLTYGSPDAGLLVVAEDNVILGFENVDTTPEDVVVNGIFIAQNGSFRRNNHNVGGMPAAWTSNRILDSLTINGTIVSANRPGYNYGSPLTSGYITVSNSYDIDLIFDPPPFTPYTSDVYQFFNWRQDG
jgi:hypothetical protein